MSVDPVFDALGDATRRQILARLTESGPATATGLAADLTISRQAVSKHLDLLRSAGLADAERTGREVRYHVVPTGLDDAARWLDARAEEWTGRTDRLRQELERRRRGT